MLRSSEFIADVAAVYCGDGSTGSFGSGRLIAPGLVLTAGHVVDYPTREAPARADWSVVLLRDRINDGSWDAPPYEADLLWRGSGDLDLALVRIIADTPPTPTVKPVFASHDAMGQVAQVNAAGFPKAWFSDKKVREYIAPGSLRIPELLGPYAWTVAPSDKPDNPAGWKGMSGAAVCHVGSDSRLYVFGAVQQVPANFSGGLLQVARLSIAFAEPEFREHLRSALGEEPRISSLTSNERMELTFDRNAIHNYWYTFDADDNRNIFRYSKKLRWSMSIFSLRPKLFATYAVTIHDADVLAYNGHMDSWVLLDNRVQSGFPGPHVAEDVKKFQQHRPVFNRCDIRPNSSEMLSIPKVGVFRASLSSEFTIMPVRWGSSETGHYVCVAVILHVHTRYLFFTCLLPEMSAQSNDPAYFVGAPEVLDVKDSSYFERRADSNLKCVRELGVVERVIVPGVIC